MTKHGNSDYAAKAIHRQRSFLKGAQGRETCNGQEKWDPEG